MSVTGVVTNPASPNTSSATLLTDVSSGATVLPVDDAGVFAEDFSEARFLVIGAEQTPREYVAVQNDEDDPAGESVTLAAAVGGSGFEAGLTVSPWDPNAAARDKRGVEYRVWVQPDGADQPVSVVVPHQWLPVGGDTETLVGARVRIKEAPNDPDDLVIENVMGREAHLRTITGSTFQTAEDGQRIVLMEYAGTSLLLFYTGHSAEAQPASGSLGGPGYVATSVTDLGGGDVALQNIMAGPALAGETAPRLQLVSSKIGATKTTYAQFLADKLLLSGTATVASLADGGSNNQNAGVKYCRVGADGNLFSSTTAPSSRTIKHDIADLDLDPQAILSLRPVTYRYDEAPDTVRVGFIAEEAHDAGLGLFVGYEDHDDPEKPTGFDYDGITAGLVAVVQQQNERIERLERLLADRAEDARHGD